MGVSGTGILDNDIAADAYAEFLGLMEEGVGPRRAVRMMVKEADLDDDPYALCPFWLGVALAQVESGRLTRRVRKMALKIIDSGMDLAIWEAESPSDLADRRVSLAELRQQITGTQIRPTPMSRPPKDDLDWEAGDVFAYQLKSGRWTAFRLDQLDGDQTRDGIFELYDILIDRIPTKEDVASSGMRLSARAKVEIAKIREDRDEVVRAYRKSSDGLRAERETEWDTNIVPTKVRHATISGSRISLLLRDFAAFGPERVRRIARGVERDTPGSFRYSIYTHDLDTVLEREFGLD